MRVEAILTLEDLQRVLGQLAPMTVRLGESAELTLEEPTEVALVPDRGLRVVCGATVRWPVLGLSVPVEMRSLTVTVSPVIEGSADGQALVFKLDVEHIDVTLLPAFMDVKVTALVKEELEKKKAELAWRFASTLSHEFGLPESLESAAALGLRIVSGTVHITADELRFAVVYRAYVKPREAAEA